MIPAATAVRRTSLQEDFRRDGFVVIRSLFPPILMRQAIEEAERLLDDHKDLIDKQNIRCRWQDNVFTGECTFETFDPVIDLSTLCRDLALNPRLLEALADVFGEPACLFKDKLIYKPPGVKGYGLHQDWIAWKGFPRSFLTVLIAFDAAGRDNGCTIVYRGYHQNGTMSEEDGNYHDLPATCVDESRAVPLLLDPGDVAIFDGFTPHRSDPNVSALWRRQLYLSYNKQSDGGEQRDKHYREFHAWLRVKYAEYGKTGTYFK